MSRMVQFAWSAFVPAKPEPGVTILDPSVTRMRVLPQDLDFMQIVNSGAYLQIMNVAGYRHMGRAGGLRLAAKQSWIGVVAASTLRYRRSLRLWDRFEDTSRVLGWDDRAFYIEHLITRDGELCTRGIVAMRFMRRRGRANLSPDDIVTQLAQQQGYGVPRRPALPADVARWAEGWTGDRTGETATEPSGARPDGA